MKKNLFILFFGLVFTIQGQIECYSSEKYLFLDGNSGQENFVAIKQPVGICFSNKFVAIKIHETITTFPVQEISISKRKGSDSALIYSFFTDKTGLHGVGYYNIEIVYSKIRKVIINNTVAGTVYLMEFKTNKYHYLEEKEFNNLDSLGKASLTANKYKPSGMGDIAPCKYCDGVVWDYGKYIYCGRCKKDTTGVSMYEIWDRDRNK